MASSSLRSQYWVDRYVAQSDMYDCPWCPKQLKAKLSGPTAKNPNKEFVSCNKSYGGCGLFCFTDSEPNEKFNPGNKRQKVEAAGTNIVGPVAMAPGVHEQRLAELATKIDEQSAILASLTVQAKQMEAKIDHMQDFLEK